MPPNQGCCHFDTELDLGRHSHDALISCKDTCHLRAQIVSRTRSRPAIRLVSIKNILAVCPFPGNATLCCPDYLFLHGCSCTLNSTAHEGIFACHVNGPAGAYDPTSSWYLSNAAYLTWPCKHLPTLVCAGQVLSEMTYVPSFLACCHGWWRCLGRLSAQGSTISCGQLWLHWKPWELRWRSICNSSCRQLSGSSSLVRPIRMKVDKPADH